MSNKVIRSERDFQCALGTHLHNGEPYTLKTHCNNCSMPFSRDIVFTPEGWIRTQSEGICEACYEDIIDNLSGDTDV